MMAHLRFTVLLLSVFFLFGCGVTEEIETQSGSKKVFREKSVDEPSTCSIPQVEGQPGDYSLKLNMPDGMVFFQLSLYSGDASEVVAFIEKGQKEIPLQFSEHSFQFFSINRNAGGYSKVKLVVASMSPGARASCELLLTVE